MALAEQARALGGGQDTLFMAVRHREGLKMGHALLTFMLSQQGLEAGLGAVYCL